MFLTIIVGTSVISFVQCAIDIATPTLGGRIGLALTTGRMFACLHVWMHLYKHPRKSIRFRIMAGDPYTLKERLLMLMEFIQLKKGDNATGVTFAKTLMADYIRRINPEYTVNVTKYRGGKGLFRLVGDGKNVKTGFLSVMKSEVFFMSQMKILMGHMADDLVTAAPPATPTRKAGQAYIDILDAMLREVKTEMHAGRRKTQRRKKARRTRRKRV